MALPLGKLAILVGAGLVGSVLAKEERMPNMSDIFSGAYKVLFKSIRHDNNAKSMSSKPRSDSLMAQVTSLQQELQLLASNRPITIVTSTGSGSSKYSIIIVVVVLGYGYVWWKGWRLPNLMFATKRGLSDACDAVAKKLDNVHLNISKTKQHLSSRIDRLDCSLDEVAEVTAATSEEVSQVRVETVGIGVDVESVHHAVRTLENKINRYEGKQDKTNIGVLKLLMVANNAGNSMTSGRIQDAPSTSSRPALEMPPVVTPSRTASLPPIPSQEPQSPSTSSGSFKVQRPMKNTVVGSGLKELYGTSESPEPLKTPSASSGVRITEETSNEISGSGFFGRRFSGISASFLTRTRSAIQPSK